LPVINHTVLDPILALDADGTVARRIVGLFIAQAPTLLGRLELAIEQGSASQVAYAAHALKSMSLTLGAQRVATCAARLEEMARRGAAPADGTRLGEIASELQAATEALEASVQARACRSDESQGRFGHPCLA
jgi:HPt (histidine-containing phosphotransfer) domain-containing protein